MNPQFDTNVNTMYIKTFKKQLGNSVHNIYIYIVFFLHVPIVC